MARNGFVPLEEAQKFFQMEEIGVVRERLDETQGNYELLQEKLVELELAAEDEGWIKLGTEGENDFSRAGLDNIVKMSRLMYLKNPLINRGVEVRSFYVWSQGVEIESDIEDVNKVIHTFLENRGNRKEFTSHAARVMKEKRLQCEGNIFFVLFTNKITGAVQLRSLPFKEVRDIMYDPEDKNVIQFYVREWTEVKKSLEKGTEEVNVRKALYPDVNYRPTGNRPDKIGDYEVKWDSPVYHVKVGGFDDMKFGVPETYAALDWAKAYKNFLEDCASLMRAVSRFAWKVTKKKKGQIAAAKKRLETTIGSEGNREANPAPTAGAMWLEDADTNLTPINKAGAIIQPADGKMFRLMAASALHLPDTILSQDPQQGALATAKTLDRPTELVFMDRQKMWADILRDILHYVIAQRVEKRGVSGVKLVDEEGEQVLQDGSGDRLTIDVNWPPIIAPDIKERIDAIVSAYGMDGKADAGMAPKDEFRRMVLTLLGVEDVDQVIAEMEDLEEEESTETPQVVTPEVEEAMREFIGLIKEAGETLVAS